MTRRQASVTAARVYDETPPGAARVLVDRVWPRGLTKEAARLDEWCKDVAPSTELRRWYAHDPNKFDEFRRRYRQELAREPGASALARLANLGRQQALVLLTATKAVEHSQAAVLADLLRSFPE
jgi:uncharacterized protein YeaO (DUF488 family)